MENMICTCLRLNALTFWETHQFQKRRSALNIKRVRDMPKFPDDVNTPVSQGAASHLLYKQRRAVEAAVLLAKQDWQRAADSAGE